MGTGIEGVNVSLLHSPVPHLLHDCRNLAYGITNRKRFHPPPTLLANQLELVVVVQCFSLLTPQLHSGLLTFSSSPLCLHRIDKLCAYFLAILRKDYLRATNL